MDRTKPIAFDAAARIPADGDNVAIATKRLEADTIIAYRDTTFRLPHTVLEGHRFVLAAINQGNALLSWGLPFGIAKRELEPGEYICNEIILRSLSERSIDFRLPDEPNFEDHLETYELDEEGFVPGAQVERVASPATFKGFQRTGPRGFGTRNFIIVLATTSQSSAFAEALAQRCKDTARQNPNIDGVVAVTHTEGGGASKPNNLEFVLRTLSGFMVHSNTGAVLAVDYGTESFSNDDLIDFMRAQHYPLDDVLHGFFRISGDFQSELEKCENILRSWVPGVNAIERSTAPLSHLKIALQCGGSDAFSGVSGNALAGWVAKQVIRNGGSANLAETDELVGAEPYVLNNVRDLDTARSFLQRIKVFEQRANHHGTSAHETSGGNKFRGLYNIVLKSIGAARKRDPEVRLDYVIDYAERMREGGFYFMDSPGNDLESIAGQVASGANMIFFITGNGSITNFPFVPTLKFVTTSGRFNLLANEMDVNAGRYNDGMPMDKLGQETFELSVRVASGEPSKGELAGHAQIQIWRNWQQTDGHQASRILGLPAPTGEPLPVMDAPVADLTFEALRTEGGFACDQIGLIMPTSLCSGQVARLIANHLNDRRGRRGPLSRYVALVHTEGCGSVNTEHLFLQTLVGYICHPCVNLALLLEHGCEQTHNDAVRHYMGAKGLSRDRFGWASVQLDGGIDKVRDKVANWFEQKVVQSEWPESQQVGVSELGLGIVTTGSVSDPVLGALARLTLGVVAGGGTVVIPENASLGQAREFRQRVLDSPDQWSPSLAYGQPAERPGLHVMESPTEDPSEILTGLGGTGVAVMLAHTTGVPLQAHPMLPLLQISDDPLVKERYHEDLDLVLERDAPVEDLVDSLLAQIGKVASRQYTPKLFGRGVTNFQLTRGILGLSL